MSLADISYSSIIKQTHNAHIPLCSAGKGLRMVKHNNPVSIAEPEFRYIHDFIVEHKLKTGYEVATAFGISMLAAGLAFKETGGRLVTMDAYIEEQYNDCCAYRSKTDYKLYLEADGYKSARYLIEHYELRGVVELSVGYSPQNTENAVKTVFGSEGKIDYAFVDALHYEDAVIADINAIKPFLSDKFVLFLHDVHCFSTGAVEQHLKQLFGKSWTVVPGCEHPGDGYNLAILDCTGVGDV